MNKLFDYTINHKQDLKFISKDSKIKNLYVNEQNSQHEVVMAWKKEQERRQEISRHTLLVLER